MTTYYSNNNLFSYTVTNNSSTYNLDSDDYTIIAAAFNKWDELLDKDPRFTTYTITVSVSVSTLDAGVLGGASLNTVYYFGTMNFGNTFPADGNITLSDSYLPNLKTAIHDDGNSSYYHVFLHELGHILGIGSLWDLADFPKIAYVEDSQLKYYYTGAKALQEYKNYFPDFDNNNFVGIPFEDDGSSGTMNVHPEEGSEGAISSDDRYINGVFHPGLDTELMSGWLDSYPTNAPLSRITLGFLDDMGYIVDYSKADTYRGYYPNSFNSGNFSNYSSYMSEWLSDSDNANLFVSSKFTDYIDISGGDIVLRNRNDEKLFVSGDISFNKNTTLGLTRDKLISREVDSSTYGGPVNTFDLDSSFNILGVTENDNLGKVVSTNDSMNIIGIGYPMDNGEGTKRGKVKVYQINTNKNIYRQLGEDITGATDNEEFGHSVDLNGDGTILAVGTKDISHNTLVYKYNSGSWTLYGNSIYQNINYFTTTYGVEGVGTVYPINNNNPTSYYWNFVDGSTYQYNDKFNSQTTNFSYTDSRYDEDGQQSNRSSNHGESIGNNKGGGVPFISYFNLSDTFCVEYYFKPTSTANTNNMGLLAISGTNGTHVGFYFSNSYLSLRAGTDNANDNGANNNTTTGSSTFTAQLDHQYHVIINGSLNNNSVTFRLILYSITDSAQLIDETLTVTTPTSGYTGNNLDALMFYASYGQYTGSSRLIIWGTHSHMRKRVKYLRIYNDVNVDTTQISALQSGAINDIEHDGNSYIGPMTIQVDGIANYGLTQPKLNKLGDKLTIRSEIHFKDSSENDLSGNYQVQSYQYSESDASWNYLGDKIESSSFNDISGGTIDINADGDVIAIGYPNIGETGYVRVYNYDSSDSSWNQIGSDITGSANEQFGKSLSLDLCGNNIAIGAPYAGDVSGGKIQVYTNNSNTWTQVGSDINIETTVENDLSMALLGNSVNLNSVGNALIASYQDTSNNTITANIYGYNTANTSWESKLTKTLENDVADNEIMPVFMNSSENKFLITNPSHSTASKSDVGRINISTVNRDISYKNSTYELQTGKVGIGIETPSVAFDISGSVHIDNGDVLVTNISAGNSKLHVAGDLTTSLNFTSINSSSLIYDNQVDFQNRLFVNSSDIQFAGGDNTRPSDITTDPLTFGTDTTFLHSLIVPGNLVIVDGSNNSSFGSYTTYSKENSLTELFHVGKSNSNVFNIVNSNNVGVFMNTGSTSFSSTSDESLKKDIQSLDKTTVDKLTQIETKRFDWKSSKKTDVGFIAQEVEEILPEIIEENTYNDGNTYKGIKTSSLLPLCLDKLKEIENRIDEL